MPPVPFDTHAVIQELEGLGFPTSQAEGLSAILTTILASTDYATKADVAEATLRLEVKLEALKSDLHKTFLAIVGPAVCGGRPHAHSRLLAPYALGAPMSTSSFFNVTIPRHNCLARNPAL